MMMMMMLPSLQEFCLSVFSWTSHWADLQSPGGKWKFRHRENELPPNLCFFIKQENLVSCVNVFMKPCCSSVTYCAQISSCKHKNTESTMILFSSEKQNWFDEMRRLLFVAHLFDLCGFFLLVFFRLFFHFWGSVLGAGAWTGISAAGLKEESTITLNLQINTQPPSQSASRVKKEPRLCF